MVLAALWLTTGATPAQALAVVEKCGRIQANETWTSSSIYLITCDVTVDAGVTVTIQAGTIVKFESGRQMDVSGELELLRTASSPVVFTSHHDDTGGDTDGTSLDPAPGDWQFIRLYSSDTTFDYATLRYADEGLYIYNNSSTDIAPTIAHSTFSNNITGVYLYARYSGSITSSIHDNTFTNNTYGLMTGSSSSYSGSSMPTVTDNAFEANGTYALENTDSSVTISAENNWWGHPSGPAHDPGPCTDCKPPDQGGWN